MNTNEILDFILPRFCPSCNKKLNPDELIICPNCLSRIKYAYKSFIENEFKSNFIHSSIDAFYPLFIFETDSPIQFLIHNLKYRSRFKTGIFLGKLIAENYKNVILNFNADYIHPVPLHHIKKAERGFNQSYYLAKSIASRFNIELRTDLLKRGKYTSTQTQLNKAEREQNIKGAFKSRKLKQIAGKNFILVDDVITTGSTIKECAKELKKSGAKKIIAVSAAAAGK